MEGTEESGLLQVSPIYETLTTYIQVKPLLQML